MSNKISKYSFEEVESKLDIVRNDMGADKVLLGNGTYGDFSNYVTTETLETTVQEKVEESVTTTVQEKVEETVKETVVTAEDDAIDALFN